MPGTGVVGILLLQRPRPHHRCEQHVRRRMPTPILQQFVGFAQRKFFNLAPSPARGSDDLAEEMRPVGDPAYSAPG